MSEARRCAKHLREHIPQWLESLSVVGQQISEKTYERTVAPGKRRSDSIHSIRPADKQEPQRNTRTVTPPTSCPGTTSMQPLTSKHAVEQHARRDPNSASTLTASESCRYRTKTMVVVYYDGRIQKSFEDLVRNIGSARNLLRKGKMAAKMEEIANMALDLSAPNDELSNQLSSKLGLLSQTKISLGYFRTTRTTCTPQSTTDAGDGFFDLTDKALEKAQNLCERAAHQHLREGRADREIEHAIKKLDVATNICDDELAKSFSTGTITSEEEVDSPQIPDTPPKPLRFSMISLEVDEEEYPLAQPSLVLAARA